MFLKNALRVPKCECLMSIVEHWKTLAKRVQISPRPPLQFHKIFQINENQFTFPQNIRYLVFNDTF